VTYLIEYLGEFEFIFETILDHESRDHMGSFDAKKKRHKKSHAWAPLKSGRISPYTRSCFKLRSLAELPTAVKDGEVNL
jgi:hypothetical protein